MTLASSDISLPSLPPELKSYIFEICYFDHPDTLVTLLLVCQGVFQRINAIRYYSVILDTEQEVTRMKRWIASQPPTSVQRNVKTMLINFPVSGLYTDIAGIVKACIGVVHLGLWLSRRVTADPPEVVSLACLSLPKVRTLWLNRYAGFHLSRLLSPNTTGNTGPPRIAFRETLTHVDWGIVSNLPLETFPNAKYVRMWLTTCWENAELRDLEEWVSRSDSNAFVLELYLSHEDAIAALYAAGNSVLNHEKVILMPCIGSLSRAEWATRCFGEDILVDIDQRLTRNGKWMHR
ncbi:hypothetical protein DL96DRAFT_1585141 [Flagelloscypha sp. PMI_526]|nr:hypothetical protein DL96DRAFT_1585141 [Flagelloscypha sp. PMI_526]